MNYQSTHNAPSPSTVIPYFATAAFSWLIFLVFTFFELDSFLGGYNTTRLIGLTHIFVLGFVTMMIIGAMLQLIPVIFQVKLWSEKSAKITYFLFLAGIIVFVTSFYSVLPNSITLVAGLCIFGALLLFAINILLTYLSKPTKDIEKLFIIAAISWLIIGVLVGITLLFNRTFVFLNVFYLKLIAIHIHVGLLGWFLQLIIGVSGVLLPMFLLNHQGNKKLLAISFYSMNISLIMWIVFKLFSSELGVVTYSTYGIGVASYLYYVWDMYKKRMKRKLDRAMRQSIQSFLFLFLPLVLILVTYFTSYGENNLKKIILLIVIYFFGFITNLIMGKTFKTLPFIVWLKIYKPFVGKEKTPLPKDLYNDQLVRFQHNVHILGVLIFFSSLVLENRILSIIGLIFLLIAALTYVYNVFGIILHKKVTL